MSLVRYRPKNHPQQVGARGSRADIDDRATTPEVFDPLNERFGFTLDVAASADNAKCEAYFTVDDDGLRQRWGGARVWCNPPYSRCADWVAKAWREWNVGDVPVIVMLLPANRTEQAWWTEMVEPYRDRPGSPLRTEFLRGRLRFIASGKTEIGPNERPPFGCVLLIWDALRFIETPDAQESLL